MAENMLVLKIDDLNRLPRIQSSHQFASMKTPAAPYRTNIYAVCITHEAVIVGFFVPAIPQPCINVPIRPAVPGDEFQKDGFGYTWDFRDAVLVTGGFPELNLLDLLPRNDKRNWDLIPLDRNQLVGMLKPKTSGIEYTPKHVADAYAAVNICDALLPVYDQLYPAIPDPLNPGAFTRHYFKF